MSKRRMRLLLVSCTKLRCMCLQQRLQQRLHQAPPWLLVLCTKLRCGAQQQP